MQSSKSKNDDDSTCLEPDDEDDKSGIHVIDKKKSSSEGDTEHGPESDTKGPTPSTSNPLVEPTQFDVLCGQDRTYNNHKGNLLYREQIMKILDKYAIGTKRNKMKITESIVQFMKQTYLSRFLLRINTSNSDLNVDSNFGWTEISNQQARDKTSHAIRYIMKSKHSPAFSMTNRSSEAKVDERSTAYAMSSSNNLNALIRESEAARNTQDSHSVTASVSRQGFSWPNTRVQTEERIDMPSQATVGNRFDLRGIQHQLHPHILQHPHPLSVVIQQLNSVTTPASRESLSWPNIHAHNEGVASQIGSSRISMSSIQHQLHPQILQHPISAVIHQINQSHGTLQGLPTWTAALHNQARNVDIRPETDASCSIVAHRSLSSPNLRVPNEENVDALSQATSGNSINMRSIQNQLHPHILQHPLSAIIQQINQPQGVPSHNVGQDSLLPLLTAALNNHARNDDIEQEPYASRRNAASLTSNDSHTVSASHRSLSSPNLRVQNAENVDVPSQVTSGNSINMRNIPHQLHPHIIQHPLSAVVQQINHQSQGISQGVASHNVGQWTSHLTSNATQNQNSLLLRQHPDDSTTSGVMLSQLLQELSQNSYSPQYHQNMINNSALRNLLLTQQQITPSMTNRTNSSVPINNLELPHHIMNNLHHQSGSPPLHQIQLLAPMLLRQIRMNEIINQSASGIHQAGITGNQAATDLQEDQSAANNVNSSSFSRTS